ncbi:MAG: hypothetical protein JWO91_3557 [Acidobacteriaceae bacterium]|nr:hypothetical protein [Acidobacteriaceae bacterium]
MQTGLLVEMAIFATTIRNECCSIANYQRMYAHNGPCYRIDKGLLRHVNNELGPNDIGLLSLSCSL